MDLEIDKMWQRQTQNQSYGGGITLILEPVNDTFQQKRVTLTDGGSIKIGRMTNKSSAPTETNGFFDSKVLSRHHADIFYRNNQVFIKDAKSSNGTFINGKRLSAEGKESCPVELKHGDDLEFGVDIVNEQDKTLLFRKVAAKVYFLQAGNEFYDVGINGMEHQKVITNGHISTKRRGAKTHQSSNTENSLLTMLEAELERARVESRYLSEIGSMLNDATNTLDSRNKRVTFADKAELRFYEESNSKLEEAQFKLKETETKLNEAISSQNEYKEKFMASDKKVTELKEKYAASEKKVTELEQKCATSEKKISKLEEKCKESDNKVIQLEQKCKYYDQKAFELEDKCKESESKIRALEDLLKGTGHSQTETSQSSQSKDLEEQLTKITNELSSTQYHLEDTRDRLKRAEKEHHASQKKCRELQSFVTKYNEAMKTVEELRSVGESYGNRIENRDETIKKFNEERANLISRLRYLEEAAKKNDTESSFLIEQLKSLNKNLKEEADKERERAKSLQEDFDIRVEEEVRRLTCLTCSHEGGLWRRHKKQESEPIKECEMTNDRTTENVNTDDKKSNKKSKRSLFIKGSIGVVVFGIGAWCLSKLYP